METSVAEVSVVEVSLALLVRNIFDGWNEGRIEDAAPVEICVAVEGDGVDVLDGAIGLPHVNFDSSSLCGFCFCPHPFRSGCNKPHPLTIILLHPSGLLVQKS